MMGSDAVVLNISHSSLWAPYKDLYNTVNAAVIRKDPAAIPDLEIALKKHKPDFISLLKNPARNSTHRDAVQKASTNGIAIAGQTGLQILSQSIVDEALLISDMFDLNELTALELLISGQQQQSHFPGLTRGLVAMLLYYDGRRSLVSALRTIVQSREGRTWTMGLNPELSAILTRFTDQLKEGLVMKVMDLIESIDITKELDLLHKNRALGGPRYRKQVTDLLGEIKQSLADIIFCWSCQSSLSCEEALRLLNHLGKSSCLSGDGSLDDVSLTLLMAFLYVNDVRYQTYENGNVTSSLKENLSAVASVHKELMSTPDTPWQVAGLKAVVQFAWGVGFRTLSQFPNLLEEMNLGENDEDDEKLIDQAIEGGVFQALNKLVIQSALFYDEEFYVKRIHSLVTEFIVLMPLRVKELRNRGDETARIITAHAQEGLEPPAHLPRHFEHLMDMISELYSQDPLNLNLSSEYWCPADTLVEQPFSQRSSQKQIALYKFLRLAGDLLPASLFVPYVNMLRNLSRTKISAHHCFSLLKMNGRNAGGQCSIVSWDHFFSTLHRYYNNLRQELALNSDTQYMYRQRLYTKGITPQEVEGLIRVLQLIAEVVKQDEVARLTLSENSQYVPVVVLLGLVTCSIAPELKAAVICALAAFASSENAFNIWQGLEAAQIIPTVKTTSVYHPSGILMELDEVETRNEKYPITRAMLILLDSLLNHPLPVTLGAGQRQPGLDPYMDFIRDSVLLRCNSRAYTDESEKWKIIILCLKILEKVLHNYHIKQEDFSKIFSSMDSSVYHGSTGPHPGYFILAHMLQDSGLLRMVLLILDEGTKIIDLYSSVPGQSDIEESALLALRLLHETLLRQNAFLEQVRDGGCNILVTSLDNLLMSVNPRSGQTDHLFVISKYIMYNTDIPEHSLYSIRILRSLCSNILIAKHMVGVFDIDSSESEMLLNGFVECLEVDVAGEDEIDGDMEQTAASARNKARQQLLLLLLSCLELPGPNLSHYLLGFNIRKPISQTVIQEPGIMGSPRTCLHAVLSLLDTGTVTGVYPSNVYSSPYAAELAYQLIYTLCADKDTSGPTLRYLRSTHDFLFRHLQYLPFKPRDEHGIKNMSQQSWLLRTLAVELRVTSAHHQRSHVQRLLSALLDDKPSTTNGRLDTTVEPVPGISRSASYSFIKSTTGPFRRRLMQILDSLDFKQSFPELPVWEYFDSTEVERLLKDCEVSQVGGPVLISVEEVHRRLTEETAALQNISGLGQRTLMSQEISSVLQFAVNYNKAREAVFVKREAFESWRQVTEVVLIACPLDVLGSDRKHQMVLEISQELIRRIMDEDILPDLMPPASGVILTLMTTLHHSVLSSIRQALPQSLASAEDDSVLQLSPMAPAIRLTHHSSLLIVLKTIVECLVKTGSGLQRVRANYYGAFLNLLCIVQKPFDMQSCQRSGVEAAIYNDEAENKKLRTEFMDTILCFGETIMEIVCHDACGGHDVPKMLALAVLDVAMSLDTHHQWLGFLVSKGYLRHLLDSLIKDDQKLQELLERSTDSYRILYVFESKIALLTRISSSVEGALNLLRNGVMTKLAECGSLDLRPDMYRLEELSKDASMWIFPDLMKSYQQILTSVLKLILSITMTLGSVHQEATVQLLSFITGHMELFLSILRDHSVMSSGSGLEELSLVTAVLSRVDLNSPLNFSGGTLLKEQKGHFLLFRHYLLALLPNLVVPESGQIKVSKLQIVAHILTSCCTTVNYSSLGLGSLQVLFSPCLADISAEAYCMGGKDVHHRPLNRKRAPELGLLVTLLNQCCSQLQATMEGQKLLLQRLQSLPTLTSDQLVEYLPEDGKTEQQSSVHMQRGLARESLTRLLRQQSREVTILSYIIESSAFILLRHLEYFIVQYKKDTAPLPHLQQPGHVIRRLHGVTTSLHDDEKYEVQSVKEPSVSQQDLDALKADIPSVIGDPFFRKLHSVEQYLSKERSHISFLEAITHRIKRLVRLRVK